MKRVTVKQRLCEVVTWGTLDVKSTNVDQSGHSYPPQMRNAREKFDITTRVFL